MVYHHKEDGLMCETEGCFLRSLSRALGDSTF